MKKEKAPFGNKFQENKLSDEQIENLKGGRITNAQECTQAGGVVANSESGAWQYCLSPTHEYLGSWINPNYQEPKPKSSSPWWWPW